MNEISTDVAGDDRKVGTHVADLVAGSIAENTRRSYGTALARIDAWAGGRPLDDHAIAAYFADLHVNGRAPATISLVAATLRFRASMTNAPDPVGAVARRTLSGIRRKGRERGRGHPRQVPVLRPSGLLLPSPATAFGAGPIPPEARDFSTRRASRIRSLSAPQSERSQSSLAFPRSTR